MRTLFKYAVLIEIMKIFRKSLFHCGTLNTSTTFPTKKQNKNRA